MCKEFRTEIGKDKEERVSTLKLWQSKLLQLCTVVLFHGCTVPHQAKYYSDSSTTYGSGLSAAELEYMYFSLMEVLSTANYVLKNRQTTAHA